MKASAIYILTEYHICKHRNVKNEIFFDEFGCYNGAVKYKQKASNSFEHHYMIRNTYLFFTGPIFLIMFCGLETKLSKADL